MKLTQNYSANIRTGFLVLSAFLSLLSACRKQVRTDVFIAGGSTSGIAAGIQAARMGVDAVIAEENKWLGGMLTSAGVSAVDGNYNLQGGLWKEFKDSLTTHYGGDSLLKTGWVSNVLFEPSIGNRIFSNMAEKEKSLTVIFDSCVDTIIKNKKGWSIKVRNKLNNEITYYRALCVIDATELGDLAKLAGIEYDIGMDSRIDTGEEIAPMEENDIIQDLTYVAILKDYGRDVTIARPNNYDSSLFACCCMNKLCTDRDDKNRLWPAESMISYGKLPGEKYMINWPISGNDYYVNIIEMNRDEREKALIPAKNLTLSFLYFIQHELGYNTLSLADDEFSTSDRLPFIPYHRESRRIRGKVRFTVNHITHPYDQPEKLYRTCIGAGDYAIDHHHGRYSGADSLPDLHFYPVPSFGLPLGVMIPENAEDIIIAEKSVSVTNIVNGATRLQPVVLQIGQASGALAALSVLQKKPVEEIAVRDVQNVILNSQGYLLPYLDVPIDHIWFRPMQRIGSTGIMKGIGKNSGWSNQTYFRAEDVTLTSDLAGLFDIYDVSPEDIETGSDTLSIRRAFEISEIVTGRHDSLAWVKKTEQLRSLTGCEDIADAERPVLRGEMALILDILLDPFNSFDVDIRGNFTKDE